MVHFSGTVLSFFTVLICVLSTFLTYAQLLENNTYYKIENKAYGGKIVKYAFERQFILVLALNSSDPNSTSRAILETWLDLPRQKWISKQHDEIIYNHGDADADTLDIDLSTCTLTVFPNVSVDYTKYWRVRDMGDGIMQIKNYKTKSCIAGQGMNMPVVLLHCDNTSPLQWKFVKLNDTVDQTG